MSDPRVSKCGKSAAVVLSRPNLPTIPSNHLVPRLFSNPFYPPMVDTRSNHLQRELVFAAPILTARRDS